jgi:glucoamylase
MPLLWSHAKFLKLLIARTDRRPLELLRDVENHFKEKKTFRPTARHWRADVPVSKVDRGFALAIEDTRPFTLHWGRDGWQQVEERIAAPTAFGLWAVQFTAAQLTIGKQLNFTRRYGSAWEGTDYVIELV